MISRFANVTATQHVASSHYLYDDMGRVRQLVHSTSTTAPALYSWGSGPLAGYRYTYDNASRITSLYSYADGSTDYSYDTVDQLYYADNSTIDDDSYTYDANGNQFGHLAGAIGINNQLIYDGTYNYEYDAEGNRQRRVEIATSAVTDYQWDHRNRLTSVRDSTSNTVTEDWGYREGSMSATYYTSATVRPAPEGSAIIVSIVSTAPSLTYTLVNRSATSGSDYAVDPNYANGQIEVPPWQTVELRLPTFANTSGETTESFEIQISDGSGQIILEADIFDLTLAQSVDYKYDAFNQLIRRTLDADGAGSGTATDTFFSHNNGQINLQFDGNAASDLTDRYLWGPHVDQLLADETVTSLTSAGNVQWPLADHLGTVRDIADRNESTGVTTITNHRRYDSFGNLQSESNAAVDLLFGFTGRAFDETTGLQNNLNRWLDPKTGNWLSEDPIGFSGGDPNLYGYVGNSPTNSTDPTGLVVAGDYPPIPPGHPDETPHGEWGTLFYLLEGFNATEQEFARAGCMRLAGLRLGTADVSGPIWRFTFPHMAPGALLFDNLRDAENAAQALARTGKEVRIFAVQSNGPLKAPPPGFTRPKGTEIHPSQIDLSFHYNFATRHFCGGKDVWEWMNDADGTIVHSAVLPGMTTTIYAVIVVNPANPHLPKRSP
jgi:RHS repeat-associated protein